MSKKPLRAAVGAALVVLCANVYAQTTPAPVRPMYAPPAAPESGPRSVRLGDSPVFFAPFLNVGAGYDDNVGLTPNNKTTSPYYVVSPGFLLDARDESKVFQFSYQSAIGQYTDSEADNYVDHTFRGNLDMAINQRNALRLGYDYIHGHEARGATDRPELSGHPDKFNLSTPSIMYAYGTPGAQGRVEAWYNNASKRYVNNRETTFLADRDTQQFGGTFYWRVMPRTHVLVEASSTQFDYKAVQSGLDSRENRVYGGVTWEATAATSGTLKIGSLRKKFDSGPRDTGSAWEGLVSWAPRTYSRVDFYTSRQPTESTGLGTFIISEAYGAVWNHSWSSLMSTTLNARHQNDQYRGATREDDVNSVGAKVAYKFRRWMTLGAEYTWTKRDSNVNASDYDRNLWMVTANFTL